MSIDFHGIHAAVILSDAAATSEGRLSQASPPAFAIPARPTADELALLVGELFQEGSLSVDQVRSVALAPEMAPRLASLLTARRR